MKNPKRIHFSIRWLLGFTALAALSVVLWMKLIYVHPTYRVPSYERATPIQGTVAKLDDTDVSIRVVVRNERDSGLYFEDGKNGSYGKLTLQDEDSLTIPRKWLDVVRIELDPGIETLGIRRLRIFDHEMRKEIRDKNIAYRVDADNDILVYGVGVDLPERLDVWLDCRIYDPSRPKHRLVAKQDAVIREGDLELEITSIGAGHYSYANRTEDGKSVETVATGRTHSTYVKLRGRPTDYRTHEVVAIGKESEETVASRNDNFPDGTIRWQFLMRYDELSHFEIREPGRPWNFFFEDVRIPKNRRQPFAAPPTATFRTASFLKDANKHQLSEFAPIPVYAEVWEGDWYVTTSSSTLRQPENSCTVLLQMNGLNGRSLELSAEKPDGTALLPRDRGYPHDGWEGWTGIEDEVYWTGSEILDHPIEEVDSITVTLK